MASVEELVKESVVSVLPSLPSTTLESVVHSLLESGVEEQGDLQYVEEADLTAHLKPIQCRKLLVAWKPAGNNTKSKVCFPTMMTCKCSYSTLCNACMLLFEELKIEKYSTKKD